VFRYHRQPEPTGNNARWVQTRRESGYGSTLAGGTPGIQLSSTRKDKTMPWTIVEQEESVGKGEKMPVLCKHLKFFPSKDKKTGEVKFGRFNFPILKVVITNGSMTHEITWSNKQNQPLNSPSPGKFIYHEKKFGHPLLTVGEGKRKRTIVDTLSPKVFTEDKTEFENHVKFWEYLARRVGEPLAMQIHMLWEGRLVEVMTKKAA
jgi:hypothetical protein